MLTDGGHIVTTFFAWELLSNGLTIQYIRTLATQTVVDSCSGIIYFPLTYSNFCRVHTGTCHGLADFVSLDDTSISSVKYVMYDRYTNGSVRNGFDCIAIGF